MSQEFGGDLPGQFSQHLSWGCSPEVRPQSSEGLIGAKGTVLGGSSFQV